MFQLHFPIMKIAHLQIYMISGFATYQMKMERKALFSIPFVSFYWLLC